MTPSQRRLCWLLVFAGALASLWVSSARWRAEAAGRRAEIILDWEEVRGLAEVSGRAPEEVLRKFRDVGARGLAIGEETLGSLQATRRVELLSPGPSDGLTLRTRLRVPEPTLRARITGSLRRKWEVDAQQSGQELTVPVNWTELSGFGVGFPVEVAMAGRAAGLEPVARVLNFERADADAIPALTRSLKAFQGRLVIFGGDQVLGFPDTLADTADAFGSDRLVFGQLEFGKQKGEAALAGRLKGDIVRVHSVSPVEMGRLSEADLTARFVRAVEERGIRGLYVRLLPGAQDPPVEENLRYVNGIARSLRQSGYEPGLAVPFRAWDSGPLTRALVGLGVAAGTALLLSTLFTVGPGLWAALLVLALLDMAAPAGSTFGRKLVALQATVVFPVLAMSLLRQMLPRPGPERRGGLTRVTLSGPAIARYALVCCISLLGGLAVVGLLSSRLGSVKLLEFSGIKLQQMGTLAAVAAIYALDISPLGNRRDELETLGRRVKDILAQPMVLGTALAILFALVAAVMLVARSGNDPGMGVSPLEMRFRSLLDVVLGVRPRTKEFLIGNPALLLGIALALLRRRRWAYPLLVLGAVGQAGMVNTFCHLHTPLAISLLRSLNGIWVGALVALAVAVVVDLLRPQAPRELAERLPSA